ncbi:LAMI_0F02630g1_1 [Lachancea mirantina]|uniref:Folic acid synthesis protein fol1 n=1 Tax=Lachancea mirantina TaxID=1230905 RepID=A0A1G4JWU0_9SACH|nr:LAMI_0F02630g1_1 [Lachancea mirantina]
MSYDKVHIEGLATKAIIGLDSWGRNSVQDCSITAEMVTNFRKASSTDDLKYSLNYAVISDDISKRVGARKNHKSLMDLARDVGGHLKNKYTGIERLILTAQCATTHIRTDDVRAEVTIPPSSAKPYNLIHIGNLKLLTLIGVFSFERLKKQFVTLELDLPVNQEETSFSSHDVIEEVIAFVENSNFKTVEALAEGTVQLITQRPYFEENNQLPVTVKVIKLNAITSTRGVGVSCTRRQCEFEGFPAIEIPSASQAHISKFDLPVPQEFKNLSQNRYIAYVAYGSNVGDRFFNILKAIELINSSKHSKVTRVSSLFQSEPMYFTDQNTFLNGCLELETSLSPHALLKFCKEIEYDELKRVKQFDNGPRSIDLDIILFKSGEEEHVLVNDDQLTIPHPRLHERSFVMEPLCELVGHAELHPITAEPIFNHLINLYAKSNAEDVLWRLIPLPARGGKERFLKFKSVTVVDEMTGFHTTKSVSSAYVMGILNVTPDSFSDGGLLQGELDSQLERTKQMVMDVLDKCESVILDVGGCSTRPNSEQASAAEELNRAIPLVQAIRSCKDFPNEKVFISVDTYRAEVALKAIEAGADIINDISGGKFDAEMFSLIANHPTVAYVLSHTRGNIRTMSSKTDYASTDLTDGSHEYIFAQDSSDASSAFIRTIAKETAEQYRKALDDNVKRWQIIIDPGIGFAKKSAQNLRLIKHVEDLKNYSYQCPKHFTTFRNLPVLVGPSRKKFIGEITGDEKPSDRDFATGALSASCVGFGADIVRVHDAKNCSKTIKLANALYRQV